MPQDDGRLERAISAFLAWLDDPASEPREAFLRRHEDLRDLLEPMVEDEPADGEPAAATDDSPGWRHLGDFRLVRELGRGGMGVVYEAVQESLDRVVALKVLPAHLTLQSSAIARFLQEARTAARLAHPGIVEIHAVDARDGVHFFTMELIRGAPLDKVVQRVGTGVDGPLGVPALRAAIEAECCRPQSRRDSGESTVRGLSPMAEGSYYEAIVSLVVQVADALDHAHEHGVLHRDVKPSNVLVRPDGSAVLTDFGLAREQGLPSLTRTGDFAGTPYYVSPEQARAESTLDRRTDVFSLGAMLYELLARQRPFDGATAHEVLAEIVGREPLDPRRHDRAIPADLAAVVLKSLEKEPSRRYASAGDMAEELRAFLAHRPVRARRIGPGVRLTRWARRNPIVAGSVAAAFLTISSALVWTLVHNRRLQSSLDDVRRLSDGQLIRELTEQQVELAAWHLDHVAMLGAWVDAATGPVSRLDLHRETLGDLRAQALPCTDEDRALDAARFAAALDRQRSYPSADPEPEPQPREIWRFDERESQWLHDTLAALVEELELFVHPVSGPWTKVRERIAFLEEQRQRSSIGASAAWREAIADIGDAARCPAYGGMAIEPQLGLEPIGKDPDSGLWEFAHLQSGEPAERGSDGRLVLEDATGIVFVLVPAGTFAMGARPPDMKVDRPDTPNVDRFARDLEGPVHEVTLDAFFVSKFEMTQGQWLRLIGHNPSQNSAGTVRTLRALDAGDTLVETLTLRAPVDTVSPARCDEVMATFGLRLPTEAQWEYVARAGSATPWHYGVDPFAVDAYGNVLDRNAVIYEGMRTVNVDSDAKLDDGFVHTAPVGSFLPNAFGLHDTIGNVAEWTSTDLVRYSEPVRAGDGEREGSRQTRVHRGGHYGSSVIVTRVSLRTGSNDGTAVNTVGLRPARAVRDRNAR